MLCYILSLVSLLNQTYRTLMVLKDQEDPIYSLVSLAVSFEVERRMIAQNDPLDEAVHQLIFLGLAQPRWLASNEYDIPLGDCR